MIIRPYKKSDREEIMKIISSLHPKWFDKNALCQIPKDIDAYMCVIATQDRLVCGFTIFSIEKSKAVIHWIGVLPHMHRNGVGSELISHMIKYLKDNKVKTIIVETVVEQEPKDGSYDVTIQFYLRHGFVVKHIFPPEKKENFITSKGILEKIIEEEKKE